MNTSVMTLNLLYQKHFLCRQWDTLAMPVLPVLPVLSHVPFTWIHNPSLFQTLFPGNMLCESLLPVIMLSERRQNLQVDSIITVTILDVICKFQVHSISISESGNDLIKQVKYNVIFGCSSEEPKHLVSGINDISLRVRLFNAVSNDLHLMCRFALNLDKNSNISSIMLSCQRSTLIMGSTGSGKTTFLHQFQMDLQSEFQDIVVLRMNGENVLKSLDDSSTSENMESISRTVSSKSQSTAHHHAWMYLKAIVILLGHVDEATALQRWMEGENKPICVMIDNVDEIYLQGCNSFDLDDTRAASINESSVEHLRYNLHCLLALMADPTYPCRIFLIATSRLDSSKVFAAIGATSSNSGAAKYPEFDRYQNLPNLSYRDRFNLLLDILATAKLSEADIPDLEHHNQDCHHYYARKLSDLTRGFSVGELVSMVSRAQRLHKEERTTVFNTTTVGELGVNLASFFEAIVETRATSQRRIRERMSIPLPTSYDEDLSQSSSGSLSFHDFVGYSEIKNQIRRILKTIPTEAESALPPQRDKALAGIIAPMRGVVIHGPVGCGKTFLAKIIASEAKMNFLSVRSSDLLSKYFGDTERQLRALFSVARESSPCVLFFDDFDVLALRRGGRAVKSQPFHRHGLSADRRNTYIESQALEGSEDQDGDDDDHDDDDDDDHDDDNVQSDLQARVLSTFLNELDGIQSSRTSSAPASPSALDSFVLVIVACRRLSRLDEALLRPGRLQCKIPLGRPDLTTIHEMLIRSLKNCNSNEGKGCSGNENDSDAACLSERDWLLDIAQSLFIRRMSSAEVRAICTEAIMAAVREDIEIECRSSEQNDGGGSKRNLTRRHFDTAMQRLLPPMVKYS